jgi:hypothetical protein
MSLSMKNILPVKQLMDPPLEALPAGRQARGDDGGEYV